MSYQFEPITLSEVCRIIGGTFEGSPKESIRGFCPLDQPSEGCITFTNRSRASQLSKEASEFPFGALVVSHEFQKDLPVRAPLVRVKDPYRAIVRLTTLFYRPALPAPGVHPSAAVHPSATLGNDVSIGAFCSIGEGSALGDNVVLYSHVVLYPGVSIGARSIIHSGAVVREYCTLSADSIVQNGAIVGADGFGYLPDDQLGLRRIPQIGTVNCGEAVEIGANSCIDRGTLGITQIGRGTKLDNLVQVGHNCEVGEFSILCGQVGIAGSSKIGNRVTLGGMVGVADHLTIGDGARLSAKAGATHNLAGGHDYAGYPAVRAREWRRQMVALRRLPGKLRKREASDDEE